MPFIFQEPVEISNRKALKTIYVYGGLIVLPIVMILLVNLVWTKSVMYPSLLSFLISGGYASDNGNIILLLQRFIFWATHNGG